MLPISYVKCLKMGFASTDGACSPNCTCIELSRCVSKNATTLLAEQHRSICWAFNSLYKRSGLLLFACKHSIYKSKFLQSYNLRPEQTGTKKRNKDEWKYSETVRSSLNFSQQNCNPFPKIRASWYIKRRCKQKTKTLHFSVNLSIWSMRVLKVSNSCWKLNSISIY